MHLKLAVGAGMVGAPDMVRTTANVSPPTNMRKCLAMPRKTKAPTVLLYLSPAMLATAFQICSRHVYRAIDQGHLEVRTLPNSMARRISVAQAELWYRNHWLPARPVKRSKKKDVSDAV
jgi:hypothetical protein